MSRPHDRRGTHRPRRADRALLPLGRLGTAQDIATAATYLASAQWTTGTILAVDGGLTIR
ncbi:SDR family oxidoreductase [Streptomyces nogalater]